MFRKVIPGFTEDAWTSNARKYAFPNHPSPYVRAGMPDFIFTDQSGVLAALLLKDRPKELKTFYLEVKTSSGTAHAFITESQSKNVCSFLLARTKIGRSLTLYYCLQITI